MIENAVDMLCSISGLSAPPYLAAFVSAIVFTFISDRLEHRGMFVAGLSTVGGAGYIILATQSSHWVRYGATFLVAVGIACCANVPTGFILTASSGV